jgi:hypothetical protein
MLLEEEERRREGKFFVFFEQFKIGVSTAFLEKVSAGGEGEREMERRGGNTFDCYVIILRKS